MDVVRQNLVCVREIRSGSNRIFPRQIFRLRGFGGNIGDFEDSIGVDTSPLGLSGSWVRFSEADIYIQNNGEKLMDNFKAG